MLQEDIPVEDKKAAETSTAEEAVAQEIVQDTIVTQAVSANDQLVAVQSQLQKAQTELVELQDQLLRKAADFDNYRKRMMKEREETHKFANASLLTDLVQVLDDFDRAIRSSGQSKDYDSFHSGIKMIEEQFTTMLEKKYGLRRFDSLGKPFEPDYHEAIAAINHTGEKSMVIEEYQKGYQLHERVLRPAKVRVGHIENIKENIQKEKGE